MSSTVSTLIVFLSLIGVYMSSYLKKEKQKPYILIILFFIISILAILDGWLI